MKKNPSILIPKPSRFGDIISYLPYLVHTKKMCPDAYIHFLVDKSCWQICNFLINHPLIDKLTVSKERDNADFEVKQAIDAGYDYIQNPYPQVTSPDYFNRHSVAKENFIMSECLIDGRWVRLNLAPHYERLSREEKCPRLYPWFDIERNKKTIAIFAESGYNNFDPSILQRSPSDQWWWKLENLLNKAGFETVRLGFKDKPKLSLFDAIKYALGCDFVIGTDSGTSWLVGAFGHPQAVIYTNYKPNHSNNPDAFLPLNYRNNLVPFFGTDKNVNNVRQTDIVESILDGFALKQI